MLQNNNKILQKTKILQNTNSTKHNKIAWNITTKVFKLFTKFFRILQNITQYKNSTKYSRILQNIKF